MYQLDITTPPNSIYSDDESIYTLDSLSSNSIEYESDFSNNYYEAENEAYELYLQKLLFEEEHKRELLLQTFGYEEDSTTVMARDLSQDSEEEFDNNPENKIRTTLYFDN